jgi:hypothetical protein
VSSVFLVRFCLKAFLALCCMSSYSAFPQPEKFGTTGSSSTPVSGSSGFSKLGLFPESSYAPPLTPSDSNSTPSSSSANAFGPSLFTPPQAHHENVDQATSALQTLVQLVMQQHQFTKTSTVSDPGSVKAPPFKAPSVDYTSAAASLLSCLSNGGNPPPPARRTSSTATLDWLTNSLTQKPSSSNLSRQVSSDSSTSASNPMIQALLNSSSQLTATSVVGRVMELATDRNGSRLLQKLLTQGGIEIVSRVIDEVEYSLPVIMCDTYANYMCQQLFQAASANQRLRLLTRLSPRFAEVARDRRGTHSLQALISHISTVEEEDLLAATLEGQIVPIALDVHATHVLQQAISCCLAKSVSGSRRLDFVFTDVSKNISRLAVDPNALGVVKRCITHSQARGFAPLLADQIDHFMFEFVENPYANYAVQHALETWSASNDGSIRQLSENLILKLNDKIAPMALHKFASNVAEMAIKSSDSRVRYGLIGSLHYEDDSRMLSLMRSPFGVFVVGTAIKHADDLSQGHALTMAICRNLKKLPDGRNKSKWEKLLTECAYSQQLFSALAAASSSSPPPTPSTGSDTASICSGRC